MLERAEIPRLRKRTDQNRQNTNFKPKESEEHITSIDEWHPLFLKTGTFTDEEVPIFPPSDFSIWSIGEEQSTRKAVALDWTPLPIAKYQRYALGVLTSNHTLAIWASTSTPTEVGSWKRVYVVNHVLGSYFRPEEDDENTWRLRRRIRSFVWSNRSYHNLYGLNSRIQYLAIANEYNEIVIISIETPHSILRPNAKAWGASALFHFSLSLNPVAPTVYSSQLNQYLREKEFASHMAWSPWQQAEEEAYSGLAIIAGGRLIVKRLKLSGLSPNTQLTTNEDVQMPEVPSIFTGPIQWVPDSLVSSKDGTSSKRMTLCAFSDSGLYHLMFNLSGPPYLSVSVRDLNDRWDDVSGTSLSLLDLAP